MIVGCGSFGQPVLVPRDAGITAVSISETLRLEVKLIYLIDAVVGWTLCPLQGKGGSAPG